LALVSTITQKRCSWRLTLRTPCDVQVFTPPSGGVFTCSSTPPPRGHGRPRPPIRGV
jgi:hypothetical protein